MERATLALRVRYFAAAKAAAGTAEEAVDAVGCLDELAALLVARHGERLGTVLGVSTFLVNGTTWHDRQAPLPPGATIDVLPPFAGG